MTRQCLKSENPPREIRVKVHNSQALAQIVDEGLDPALLTIDDVNQSHEVPGWRRVREAVGRRQLWNSASPHDFPHGAGYEYSVFL